MADGSFVLLKDLDAAGDEEAVSSELYELSTTGSWSQDFSVQSWGSLSRVASIELGFEPSSPFDGAEQELCPQAPGRTEASLAERLRLARDLLWAASVGGSVTLRLFCSVCLSKGTGASPVWASCFVVLVSHVVSCAFLAPFTTWRSLPRRPGPWLAGLCTLPAFSFVAAAGELGLGLTQMVLRLATLTSALSLDSLASHWGSSFWWRVSGTVIVFVGVAIGISSGLSAGAARCSALTIAACIASTLVSGACYVLQARLVARRSCEPSDRCKTCADALACQLANTAVLAPALLACSLAGGVAFEVRAGDAPLWLFAGLQGAFYLRSMQMLPARLGYSTAFAVSLWGQLVTAAALDVLSSGGAPVSAGQLLGLGLVLCGATVSAVGAGQLPSSDSAPE